MTQGELMAAVFGIYALVGVFTLISAVIAVPAHEHKLMREASKERERQERIAKLKGESKTNEDHNG